MTYKVLNDHKIIIETIFLEIIKKSHIAKRVNVALLGGSTVAYIVDYLNKNAHLHLDTINFFMGDERIVPLDNSENNSYNFLKNLKLKTNTPRFNTSLSKLEMKNEYIGSLEHHNAIDGFDFMILGVGTDGHTLSVFPKDLEKDLQNRNILDFYVRESDNQKRISFTIPFAMKAKKIFFIAIGDAKKEIVRDIIINENKSLPVTSLLMGHKNAILYCDKNAGKLLEECINEN